MSQTDNFLSRQAILDNYYLRPLDGSQKTDIRLGKVERVIHGVMHACRTEVWVVILTNMLAQLEPNFKQYINDDYLLYLGITALMHDSARQGEGRDAWESESEENCQNLLEGLGLTQEQAYEFASLITSKEKNYYDLAKTPDEFRQALLRMILQSADALDIIRCVEEFDLSRLACWQLFEKFGQQEMLIQLAIHVLNIIADQQDLMYDCKIMLNGKCLHQHKATLAPEYTGDLKTRAENLEAETTTHDDDLKKQLEHSTTFTATLLAQIRKNPDLAVYCSELADELPKLPYQETETQQKRKAIRDSATKTEITGDFIVKGLRDGVHSLEFYDGVLPDYGRQFLRRAPKRKFVVDGNGVRLRSQTTPQYTQEQKRQFSKAQPVSMGTINYHTPVFNFADKTTKLIGAIFLDKADFLLSNKLYIYDFGSEGRPGDFNDELSAEVYFDANTGCLFSMDRLDDFKKTIESDEFRQENGLNECLVRLHWSPSDKCKIIINSDSLDTRLLAQSQARIIKRRLLAKQACDEGYDVSIIYYNPRNPAIHLREYTYEEQILDRQLAIQIASSDRYRKLKYKAGHFEFLLALSKNEFDEVYAKDDTKNEPLLCQVAFFNSGHINDFLRELALIDDGKLEQALSSLCSSTEDALQDYLANAAQDPMPIAVISKSLNKGPTYILSLLFSTIQMNNTLLFDAIMKKLRDHELVFKMVFVGNSGEEGLLIGALRQTKNPYFLNKIIDLSMLLEHKFSSSILFGSRQFTYAGQLSGSILHAAAKLPYTTYLRMILNEGYISNINMPDQQGKTPLHYAAGSGNIDSIQALLSIPSIKYDALDKNGCTPLEIAIAANNLDAVNCFIDRLKLNPSSVNPLGQSIVQLALKYSSETIFRQFTERDNRVDINHQDKNGNTVLHDAVNIALSLPNDMILHRLEPYIQSLYLHGIDTFIANNEQSVTLDPAFKVRGRPQPRILIVCIAIAAMNQKVIRIEGERGLEFEPRTLVVNQLKSQRDARQSIEFVLSDEFDPLALFIANVLIDATMQLDKEALINIEKFKKHHLSSVATDLLRQEIESRYQFLFDEIIQHAATKPISVSDFINRFKTTADSIYRENKPLPRGSWAGLFASTKRQQDVTDESASWCCAVQ